MLPKHHKTSFFLKAGLFDNLSSFAQLEKRISGLPTTVEVGDAFEVFAEAYFFTQKIEQAEEVWPFKSVPSSIKEDLSLGTNQQDMGVDGVYKTTSGTFNAYQAKFRTGRPSLTWREISTFMGLTDNVNQRVLFTNSNDITSVINERTGFHCIRGNDLDRLDKNDFEIILKWLQSGEVEVERKIPLPHQGEAIKDILTALKDENRATALMACGTGKTLVALWVSEQMDCQNILVLLPSLTLVRQTLHEWLKETKWKHLSYLCVCSDPTVASKELDSIKVNQSDLDFAVTTFSSTVKQFLSQDTKGVKIVFSTYQSAHIVAEGMDNNYGFDLGIFDEAHKTAGRVGKKFGFALKNENLSIKNRLFLTATPRHYNLNKRNKEGDFDLAYSMDNPDVYGRIAHQLSFAAAARQDIICNYKVIISVVTSEQVNKEMLKRGEVLIEGDIVNAQQVAHQIAFKEAISKYNINRIFTFHKSVKSAKAFTGKDSEGIQTQLPEFNTFHVNGKMSTAEREGIMNEFKDSDSSVISNARCLTEGVDLPAVDMVAFMSPKKSKVDIIQATGRAMRKDPHNPDKTLGYILVPLYLEMTTGESIENAVDEASFEEVWNVLQALQEQDDVIADIIRQMREDKGRYGIYKSNRLKEKIDILGVNISLESLRAAITAICINQLGLIWDEQYGRLIKHKEHYGDCNVPQRWPEDRQLGSWVATQRASYLNREISKDRIKRLEDIGFEWKRITYKPSKASWEEMYNVLKEYKRKRGDCNVPSDWPENKHLATWVSTQRRNYNNSDLSGERIKRLDDIDFTWNTYLTQWEKMYDMLVEYEKYFGDCRVPHGWLENKQLASWVKRQRMVYYDGQLSKDQVKRLKSIGFTWNPDKSQWEKMYEVLKEYKAEHGDCNIPSGWPENKELASWVRNQRVRYKEGNLGKDRTRLLENIGFVWNILEASWEEMFQALNEYKKKYEHCNVAASDTENMKLGTWVSKQRKDYQTGILGAEKIKRLEDIGFEWKRISYIPSKASWEVMFDVLIEYKENHGDCNVPSGWPENKQLATWVAHQRTSYRRSNLSDDRIKLLEDIGFVWNILESTWEEMFDALKEYEKSHGDCNIPQRWPANKPLASWVSAQRIRYQRGKLSEERVKRLEDIGFSWDILEASWEEMFEELKRHKSNYGHCNVPRTWTENKHLASWVIHQRASYKKATLSDDKIKRLEDIGFVWNRFETLWDKMFEVLEEYKRNHGHCNVPSNWRENNQLGSWVASQRSNYRESRLNEDQIKRLEDIGFVWNPFESLWEEMFDALKEYKRNHGHCNVPNDWTENRKLAGWVGKQRQAYRKENLSEDRVKRLEDIGFMWNIHKR